METTDLRDSYDPSKLWRLRSPRSLPDGQQDLLAVCKVVR